MTQIFKFFEEVVEQARPHPPLEVPDIPSTTNPYVISPTRKNTLEHYSLADLIIIEKEALQYHRDSGLSDDIKLRARELALDARAEHDHRIRALIGM